MHDSLGHSAREPIHRQWHHNELTFALVSCLGARTTCCRSRTTKRCMERARCWQDARRPLQGSVPICEPLAYMWAHPGKQLLFMGSEFGQESEGLKAAAWTGGCSISRPRCVEQTGDRSQRGVPLESGAVELDTEPAGFEWIDANDAGGNTLSWIRRGLRARVVLVVNFSAVPHHDYRWGFRSAAPGQK